MSTTPSAASSAVEDAAFEPGFTTSFADSGNHGSQIGQNFGTVVNNLEFHDRPETPPNPSSLVPFPRDPQFVERGDLLEQIHERCFSQTKWAALVGLGGVGKSQLAIEYSYRVRDRATDTWVFWVHASNAARFEQGYQDIADVARIYGRKNPQANILQIVSSWLRDPKNGRWILILDNLDDASFLTTRSSSSQTDQASVNHGQSQFLIRHVPHTSHGSVLVTTRTKAVAIEMVDRIDIIAVPPMDGDQSAALLKTKLGENTVHEESQIATLATTLDFMPLAMVQAAAYISSLRYSIQTYLDKFQKSDRRKKELLSYDEELGCLRRDFEAQNAITATWQISFDHIRQTRPAAADLLSLASFFDRQAVPTALLQPRPKSDADCEDVASLSEDNDHDSASEFSDSPDFRRDLRTLENYSFITINDDASTLEMHSLVQLATRQWLQENGQTEMWRQHFIAQLHAAAPMGAYNDWPQWHTLLPHVKSAMSQKPQQDSSLQEWATILHCAASYCQLKGDFAVAEDMSMKATKARGKVLGPSHSDTLLSKDLSMYALMRLEKWKEAEEIGRDVMERRKRKLGEDHFDTLLSVSAISQIYSGQCLWDVAEQQQEQVLSISTEKLGTDHLFTLSRKLELATTYWYQGRYEAAEELGKLVVGARQEKMGADHPETLDSMQRLARIYRSQGRYETAENIQQQVVETCKKGMGADHPYTLSHMHEVAMTYYKQGRYEAEAELEEQVLEMRKKRLGPHHPETLQSMQSLILTYTFLRRGDVAEELATQLLEVRRSRFGMEHVDTLRCMCIVAGAWRVNKKRTEAVELMEESVQLASRILGVDHRDTRSFSKTLATWKAEDTSSVAVSQ